MTSIQPRLVRADTLDLQSHDAPSAQDHSRSPTYTGYSQGPSGPHHREALRNAEENAYMDMRTSPRVSMENGNNGLGQTHLYDSADEDGEHDDLMGPDGVTRHQEGDFDGEGDELDDEDLDDDLMDKISSSPSIEDGKYPFPPWPPRLDSMDYKAPIALSPLPLRGIVSAHIPSLVIFPNMREELENRPASHHKCKFRTLNKDRLLLEKTTIRVPVPKPLPKQPTSMDAAPSPQMYEDISDCLLPVNDPILESALQDFDMVDTNNGNNTNDNDVNDENDDDDDDESNWIDEEEFEYFPSSEEEEVDDDYDDDTERSNLIHDSRFIDSGWGGECLRETEDIDFEFVYALHTFVATVEGQANAKKGDTMVLLDDSNSYWWLVRVVKDGSIGYLPAEHIETPTERLARLNKHRNIDLSASMLGDNPEKSKNPLKKAMRRRNAKSVAFAAPTYYEPSEYEYSSDEEVEDDEEPTHEDGQQIQNAQQNVTNDAVQNESKQAVNGVRKVASDDQISVEDATSPTKADEPQPAESQAQVDETFQRSRNGVVRNTDSFFKDDTGETKKISLTPRLLRGDSDSNASVEPERPSLDNFDKIIGEDKSKDDKKKKEKKGMLSGLFKRSKDKKSKSDNDELHSPDDATSPRSKDSMESVTNQQQPERKPSKLQKSPPTVTSPKLSPIDPKASFRAGPALVSPTSLAPTHSPQTSISRPAGTTEHSMSASQVAGGDQPRSEPGVNRFSSQTEKKSIFAPITTVLKSGPGVADHEPVIKPVYAKRAKERFAIDASDSEDDPTPTVTPAPDNRRSISPMRESQLIHDRPDSAMQVSPIESQSEFEGASKITEEDEDVVTPIDIPGQSDTASTSKQSPSIATHTPSTSRSTPTWSDASLRSYMENDQDIRDLLIIVHDKSNVTPVGPEHPLMGGLFISEKMRLAEMQTQLDSMLTSWISKKNPGLLAK